MKSFLYCLTLLLAAACLTAGCRGGGGPVSSSGPMPPPQPEPPAPVVFGPTADLPTDQFDLNSAAVTGNVLTLSVSYSGGCRSHEFVLTAADSFFESSPVQLPLVLTHEDNGDTCEAYPTEQRRFDLTPIKQRYQTAYGEDSGTVLLLLYPLPLDDDQPIVYQF